MIVVDETLGGDRLHRFSIESLDENLTVREIIRARIWQEVQEYNASQRAVTFKGLVQPTETETRLNGPQSKAFKPIDWEKQFETAIRSFQTNGFFILIGDRQAESLDEVFKVGAETEVSFVKFVPLVGG
ncbi:MAG: hypothetical protein V4640_12390 [Verrucomicrobiota bacterium]